MTEPDNFLERWSRRKLAKGEPDAANDKERPPQQQAEAATPTPNGTAEAEPFDPASLPSIDSIGANTDVTAFLRPGVPPELTRAALRRAWSNDPAIRDFVGLVENGWDFNDPQAMPGFGPIDPVDVARLISQTVGQVAAPAAETEKTPAQEDRQIASRTEDALTDDSAEGDDVHRSANDAPQNKSDS